MSYPELLIKIYEDIRDYITRNPYDYKSLIVGNLFFIVISCWLITDIEMAFKGLSNYYKISIFFLIIIGWNLFWVSNRKLPKGKKGKFNIIISINTPHSKQLVEFSKGIKRLANQNGLGIIEVITLNQFNSNKLSEILFKYMGNKHGEEENYNFEKIKRKTNGSFFIFGDINDKISKQKEFIFRLSAIVSHANHKEIKQHIEKGFACLWPQRMSIEESVGFEGMELAAEAIFIIINYIFGIVALSINVNTALEVHKNLYESNYLQKFNPLPSNLLQLKLELEKLITIEYWLIAQYFNNLDDLEEAKTFLNKSLAIKVTYNALVIKSFIQFKEGFAKKALKTINESKKLTDCKDGVWRYNKGFLLFFLEDFKSGLKVYKQIIKNSYLGENATLAQIYQFNINFLANNPASIYSNFIIGYLKFHKQEKIDSLEYFEVFLEGAKKEKDKFKDLITEAESCLKDVKKIIGIN